MYVYFYVKRIFVYILFVCLFVVVLFDTEIKQSQTPYIHYDPLTHAQNRLSSHYLSVSAKTKYRRNFSVMSGWPSGLRRCVQVAVWFSRRGFESHF